MKRTAALATTLLTLITLTMLTACPASTPRGQYQTLGVVKIAADTAMTAWADRVIDGKATPDQEAKVRAAFASYQSAYAIAINQVVNDQAPPPLMVTDALNNLLVLLQSFGVKTGGSK